MKILFVDDEPNILNALRRVMRSSGGSSGDWEIETTDDPEAALRMVERESVAVVVSDQRMPSMVGSDLLEAIRLKSPQTRRMILTGYADMNSAMDAINKGGAHRYLAKPWDDEILRQAIYEGVEQYRLAQENFRLKVSLEKKNEALVQLSRTMERKVVERTQDLGSLNERLQSELKGVIQLLLKLEESHSVTVFGHSNRVFEWSTRVGEALGLSEEMRYQLGVAAQLHDIGKIGLPLALLSKPMMVMSPYEKSVYQSHAARRADWLAQIPQFKLSASVVRYHHELMDGSGFPEGRVGKEIPLGARILCAVDALDQWLQTQPALDAEAVREGLRVLEADRNLLYDGEVLDALRQVTNVYMPLNPVIQEVAPSAIQEGMILARDLLTSQGMLVLKQGSVITPYNYDKVVSLLRKQTPLDGVYVYQPVNLKV